MVVSFLEKRDTPSTSSVVDVFAGRGVSFPVSTASCLARRVILAQIGIRPGRASIRVSYRVSMTTSTRLLRRRELRLASRAHELSISNQILRQGTTQLISRVIAAQYVWHSSARRVGAKATTTVITWRML
jgi:hypothetical protein